MTRRVLLVLAFIGFLIPMQIGSLSVNYSFALLPIVIALYRGEIRRPPDWIFGMLALYFGVLLVASLYQFEYVGDAPRRAVSFLLFVTIFAYAFVDVDGEMMTSLKLAVIAISVVYSLRSIMLFIQAGPDIGFEAKDLLGSQRYGFIYLIAFWLVYLDPLFRRGVGRTVRLGLLFVLATGLMLTFSRSSIVAFLVPALLYGVQRHREWLLRPTLRGVGKVLVLVAGIALLGAGLYRTVPVAFAFFGERLLDFLTNSDVVATTLSDRGSSEGARVELARQILEFVSRHPVTGSGFLGVWILPDAPEQSAHNQYTDVLFRTGVLGLMAYLYLLTRVGLLLARRERGLFWGFVGVLAYGMFHETFKESQGAFVLAVLVGALAQAIRDARFGRPAAEAALKAAPGTLYPA